MDKVAATAGSVVWVVPDETPEAGGNWVSAQRLARAWRTAGGRGEVVRLSDPRPACDLVHAFNAVRTGLALLAAGVDPSRLIVTWTGTDLVSALDAEAAQRLGRARLHTVFTAAARADLAARFPGWAAKVEVVPPGVDSVRIAIEGPVEAAPHPLVLLAGGGRAEKGTLDAIAIVEAVRGQGWPAHLAILGPVRAEGYWQRVEAAMAARPWVHWAGAVEGPAMPRWYRAAEVVLNASWVEGLSNALLEAMACARPVVARDIPGNRAVIESGRTGWLFADNAEAAALIGELLADPARGQAVGQAARQAVLARYHPDAEARAWCDRYRALIARPCASPIG